MKSHDFWVPFCKRQGSGQGGLKGWQRGWRCSREREGHTDPPYPASHGPGPLGSDELQRVGQGVAARVAREVQDSLMLSRGEAENRAKGWEGVPGTA